VFLERQRPQQHCVDNAEYRRSRAHPESDDQNRESGQAQVALQGAEAVTDILQERFERWEAPAVAMKFLGLFRFRPR
jgi:hypothetical protein